MSDNTNPCHGYGHFQANPGNSPQQPVEYVPPCQLDGCRANAWFDVRTNTYSNACTLKHRAEINQQNRAQSGVPGCQYPGCQENAWFDRTKNAYSVACSIACRDALQTLKRSGSSLIPLCQICDKKAFDQTSPGCSVRHRDEAKTLGFHAPRY
jgi:hypothetical protein